jgi:hypothetical protein
MESRRMSNSEELIDEVGKRFLKRHWRMAIVFALLFSVAAVVGLVVLLWFVETAQVTGLVPAMIGQWTIGYTITFILHLIFWELLLVGSWVLVIIITIMLRWYKNLPEEEREGWPKRGRREESDAFGFLFGIAWLIVVFIDGRWDLAFESWPLDYWIYSCLSAAFWILLIFGAPIALYFIYRIWLEIEAESEQPSESIE